MEFNDDDGSVRIEKGDTLLAVAARLHEDYPETYGNMSVNSIVEKLATRNDIANPDYITVDQKLDTGVKSGSSGSSTKKKTETAMTVITITQFGLLSTDSSKLYATWNWSRANTASYKAVWYYDTGDGVWFVGSDSNITYDKEDPDSCRQSIYSIPAEAKRIKFRVKPIAETKDKNGSSTALWTVNWSTEKIFNVNDLPPVTPEVPTVTIEKNLLTAIIDNLDVNATEVQFQVVKNNSSVFKTGTASIRTAYSYVQYTCTIDLGSEYKVRCRAKRDGLYSDWTNYCANITTIPSVPSGITVCRATSKTSVYLEWTPSTTANTYDLEYTTKKEYFDGSDQTTTQSSIEFTHFEKTGLESGQEYFFRVRAVNEKGNSGWSEIKSVVIGEPPAAPTTWSSATTVVTGERLVLYWVHNARDESSQTMALLEMYVDGIKELHTIENTENEDEKDRTSFFEVDTSKYVEGTKIQWRVCTAGIMTDEQGNLTLGDWSIQRTVDIYATPTLELSLTDIDGEAIDILESFPCYVRGLTGPDTQMPIGYHVVVTALDTYDTVDSVGNPKTVNAGSNVYSRYFETNDELLVELSAGNIDLENNVEYRLTCTASMNSGLTAESSIDFIVGWAETAYVPNVEIGIEPETLTAWIRPYCEHYNIAFYKVNYSFDGYVRTSTELEYVRGTAVVGAKTTTGDQVWHGTDGDGVEVYYCRVDGTTLVADITLSVYRREFDGSFTELASGLANTENTFIVDPHPALDYARYRVVATSTVTGAAAYYDAPGYPVGGKSVIIQWDEEWSMFDLSSDDVLEQPPWSGSLLELPYNIDVSNQHSPDVELVEYIGREHPTTYYGTQIGERATWSVTIDKSDKETLYSLRRLARWMGDVYVREPSGSGYWANITVSFNQKHTDPAVPVTLDIVRVEGGI